MSDLIQIEHLSKRFGPVQAVDDLSFRVKEGELFAFLGVNGAGKSTTINILCGQLPKDSGIVTICGINLDTDASRIKQSLGVVFQNSVLDSSLLWRPSKNRSMTNPVFASALFGATFGKAVRFSGFSRLRAPF